MDLDSHIVVFMAWVFASKMSADKGVRCLYKCLGDGCAGVAMCVTVLCVTPTQKVPVLCEF